MLLDELSKVGSMCFFIGGDNYMAPVNNVSEEELHEVLDNIYQQTGFLLKSGIGIGKKALKAADLADIGLEKIRAKKTDSSILVLKDN